MTASEQSRESLKQKLNREAGKIEWQALQRFFAAGEAVYVAPELDLIEVASDLALDNKTALEPLISAAKFARVSDQQASRWLDENALVWAVVVAPLVLVQPLS